MPERSEGIAKRLAIEVVKYFPSKFFRYVRAIVQGGSIKTSRLCLSNAIRPKFCVLDWILLLKMFQRR